VLPNGTLVVVAGDFAGEAALTGSLVAARSTDGGATFTTATIAQLQSASNGAMRAIALPSVDVDSAGTIYAYGTTAGSGRAARRTTWCCRRPPTA
jgi:hypothetical protein